MPPEWCTRLRWSLREDNDQMETYTGLTGGTFKDRFYKHMSDFRNEELESSTGLSKYIWKLKRENIPHKVRWKKLARARVFNPVTKTFQLCLKAKYLLMFSHKGQPLMTETNYITHAGTD